MDPYPHTNVNSVAVANKRFRSLLYIQKRINVMAARDSCEVAGGMAMFHLKEIGGRSAVVYQQLAVCLAGLVIKYLRSSSKREKKILLL